MDYEESALWRTIARPKLSDLTILGVGLGVFRNVNSSSFNEFQGIFELPFGDLELPELGGLVAVDHEAVKLGGNQIDLFFIV